MEKTTSQQEWNLKRHTQDPESFWYMVKIPSQCLNLCDLLLGSWKRTFYFIFLIIIIVIFLLICFFLSGSCTSRDISISQSRDSTSGIPQYIVQIVNTCVRGCAPSNIHLHCGWFASARMVNRMTFKRLSYDDCLVNEGKPLKTSQIISFTYSNSFMYPLAFKTAKFCWTSKVKTTTSIYGSQITKNFKNPKINNLCLNHFSISYFLY